MEAHDLTWIAGELGLPTLTEGPSGLIANGPAKAALEDELPSSIEMAASALVGLPPFHAELVGALERARRGETVTLKLEETPAHEYRMVASPAGHGFARLTIAPSGLEQTAAVQRRASLVDVAAAVSHEVANAMSAIGGWAELAIRGDATGIDPAEALTLIASCARTAEQAARRMLSLSRGDVEGGEARTDISELTSEVSDLLLLTAREKQVTLHAHVEPSLVVSGSRAQLFTIVWNLAKNAIEACEPGGSVQVSLLGDDAAVQIEVRDTGAGLDTAAQERIFKPYYTTKAGGTGLGLSLVRDAIQELGGAISVKSTPGVGTVFVVELPRIHRTSDVHGPAPENTRVHSEEAPTNSHLLDARVLVVDDDDALREMVATALTLRGARVTTARSAEQARSLEPGFDVALIDMMLNDGRGDELLAQLRKRGVVNAAMLVTGTVQKPRLVVGGEPDDWVRKPFEIGHLVDRLRRTLERHRMLNAATATMRF
jgi:signal transduction histidine kinase/ActR/RegA family two-component response regulator